MSEKELLELAIQKDEKAFVKLIDDTVIKVRPSIFNAYNPLNTEDFKDALQNATVKAWNKIESFRGESHFSTWFYIILKNEVLNTLKAKNIVKKHEISMEEIAKLRNPDGNYDSESIFPVDLLDNAVSDTAQTILEKQDEVKQLKDMLDLVLSKLSPSHGEVIRLVFEQGKSYKEVSDELNIPVGTVMSRIYFARLNAQKLIKQHANRNKIQLSCLG